MTLQDFDAYLRTARDHKVRAFKLGELSVEFELQEPVFAPPTLDPSVHSWKRNPDLDSDPELDSE